MSTAENTGWNVRCQVQPTDGSGFPEARVTVTPGQRYRFEIIGTVKTSDGTRHLCNGADLEITDDCGGVHYFDGSSPSLTVVRATAHWPPQTGDVWKDEKGVLWFVRRARESFGVMEMVSSAGDGTLAHTEQALAWTLVFREGTEL
jgi:hypothetical protein